MNDTLKTIKNRYSCRNYTGEPVEQEKLEAIALAGIQAPSAMNNQPWEIIVIKDKALIDEMDAATMEALSKGEDKSLYERMMSRGGKMFYNAPCMIVVAKLPNTDLDCGIVIENLALAASSLGLGNVICGLAGLAFATEKGEYFKSKIIPEGYELGMTILIGYATDTEGGMPHEVDMGKVKYV